MAEPSPQSRCVPSDCCHVSGNCQREDKTNCLEYGCQIYGDNELSAAYGRIRFLEAKQRSERGRSLPCAKCGTKAVHAAECCCETCRPDL